VTLILEAVDLHMVFGLVFSKIMSLQLCIYIYDADECNINILSYITVICEEFASLETL